MLVAGFIGVKHTEVSEQPNKNCTLAMQGLYVGACTSASAFIHLPCNLNTNCNVRSKGYISI